MRFVFDSVARLGLVVTAVGLAGCYNVGDIGSMPFQCTPDFPDCPDGYQCALDRTPAYCVPTNGPGPMNLTVTIPKTGMYTGPHIDRATDPTACTNLEPNDDFGSATPLFTGPMTNIAICMAGDVDVYDYTAAGEYVRVKIIYDIKYGDLDLAFVDQPTSMILPAPGSDGSSASNGCISSGTKKFTGAVYIAVVGAGNTQQNTYQIQLENGTAPLPCTAGACGATGQACCATTPKCTGVLICDTVSNTCS